MGEGNQQTNSRNSNSFFDNNWNYMAAIGCGLLSYFGLDMFKEVDWSAVEKIGIPLFTAFGSDFVVFNNLKQRMLIKKKNKKLSELLDEPLPEEKKRFVPKTWNPLKHPFITGLPVSVGIDLLVNKLINYNSLSIYENLLTRLDRTSTKIATLLPEEQAIYNHSLPKLIGLAGLFYTASVVAVKAADTIVENKLWHNLIDFPVTQFYRLTGQKAKAEEYMLKQFEKKKQTGFWALNKIVKMNPEKRIAYLSKIRTEHKGKKQKSFFLNQYYAGEVARLEKKLGKKPSDNTTRLELATIYPFVPEDQSNLISESYWREVLGSDPDSIELNLLRGQHLDSIGKRDEAVKHFNKAVEMILQDNQGNFVSRGDFRNEVFDHYVNEYFHGILYWKRNKDPERLRKENKNLKLLGERFMDRLAMPVGLKDLPPFWYFITISEGEKNLFDMIPDLNQKQIEFFLKDAANLCTDITSYGNYLHKKGRLELKTSDDKEFYYKRMKNLFFDPLVKLVPTLEYPTKTAILRCEDFLSKQSNNLFSGFYSDFNHKNLVPVGKQLKKVDMEHDTQMPLSYELVNLFEFGKEHLKLATKQKLINTVYENLDTKFSQGRIRADFTFGAIQRHGDLFGYRLRDYNASGDEQDLEMAKFHFKSKVNYLKDAAYFLKSDKDTGFLVDGLVAMEDVASKIME